MTTQDQKDVLTVRLGHLDRFIMMKRLSDYTNTVGWWNKGLQQIADKYLEILNLFSDTSSFFKEKRDIEKKKRELFISRKNLAGYVLDKLQNSKLTHHSYYLVSIDIRYAELVIELMEYMIKTGNHLQDEMPFVLMKNKLSNTGVKK